MKSIVPILKKMSCLRPAAMAMGLMMCAVSVYCQPAADLIATIKSKLEKVNDYTARGKMKTNVAFIKAPVATIQVYYEKPGLLRIVNQQGISFIPRGSVNITLNNVFSELSHFDIIDGGKEADGLRVVKLLPKEDTSDIVLSTFYIDEASALIMRSRTTTRENGTYELSMTYGKYISWGLPDRVVFSFNTRDYKLPKGITLDYDEETEKKPGELKNRKGTVEITYSNYQINKGVDPAVFSR
jgi:hypothetical protein